MASKWRRFVERCKEFNVVSRAIKNLFWIAVALFTSTLFLVVTLSRQCRNSTPELDTSIRPQVNSFLEPVQMRTPTVSSSPTPTVQEINDRESREQLTITVTPTQVTDTGKGWTHKKTTSESFYPDGKPAHKVSQEEIRSGGGDAPIPTTTPEPTPTPIQKTENEIRETLISLGYQAVGSPTNDEQDAKLKVVVNESLSYGQLDLALWAARNGALNANQSSMLAKVAECIAIEGEFELARRAARFIPLSQVEQQTLNKIFELEHKSLRETPPPSCRNHAWLVLPEVG